MKRLISVFLIALLVVPVFVGCEKKEKKPAVKGAEEAVPESVVTEQEAVPESLQEAVPETLGK